MANRAPDNGIGAEKLPFFYTKRLDNASYIPFNHTSREKFAYFCHFRKTFTIVWRSICRDLFTLITELV